RPVRAHSQRLAHGLGGILRPHGQDRYRAAVLLLHAQRLLDGHFVVATHGLLGRRAVEAPIGQERLLGRRQRGLLDANDDCQRHISSQLTQGQSPYVIPRVCSTPASLPLCQLYCTNAATGSSACDTVEAAGTTMASKTQTRPEPVPPMEAGPPDDTAVAIV